MTASRTPLADMVAQLLAAGCPPDVIVMSVRTAESAMVEAVEVNAKSRARDSDVVNRRREWDKKRKAAQRAVSGGQSALPQSQGLSSFSVKDSLSSKKENKTPVSGGNPPSRVDTLVPLDDWPDDYEKQFWDRWPDHPRKHSRKQVMAKLARVRRDREATWAQIMSGLADYLHANRRKMKYIPAPLVWVNQHQWVANHRIDLDSAAGDGQPTFADYQRMARGNNDGQ